MESFKKLVKSSKFWVAVWAVAQAVIAYAAPNFPREIKLAVDALVAVVIGTIAIDEVRAQPSQWRGESRGILPTRFIAQRAGWIFLALGAALTFFLVAR